MFEPEGFGDTSDYGEVLRADLDRMSVEELCEQWGIDRGSDWAATTAFARLLAGRRP